MQIFRRVNAEALSTHEMSRSVWHTLQHVVERLEALEEHLENMGEEAEIYGAELRTTIELINTACTTAGSIDSEARKLSELIESLPKSVKEQIVRVKPNE